MTDTVDRILADLRARRDELKPLVAELERVEAAIDALEQADSAQTRRGPGRPPGSRNKAGAATGTGRRRGRPRKGEPNRSDQFLDLVRRGAISIPDAARELGIGPNYLYRIAGTLEAEGTIRKEGKSYTLANGLVTNEGAGEGAREIATE